MAISTDWLIDVCLDRWMDESTVWLTENQLIGGLLYDWNDKCTTDWWMDGWMDGWMARLTDSMSDPWSVDWLRVWRLHVRRHINKSHRRMTKLIEWSIDWLRVSPLHVRKNINKSHITMTWLIDWVSDRLIDWESRPCMSANTSINQTPK